MNDIKQPTDIRQSHSYGKFIAKEGWTVERIRETNYFIRKMFFLGSILKIQRPRKLDFFAIKNLVRKYGVFHIIIEPALASGTVSVNNHNLLLQKGFKQAKNTYLPSKTLFIDLTKSQNDIFKAFKKDARQAVKRGEVIKTVEYSTGSELKKFNESWKKSVKFDRYVPSLKSLINLKNSFPQKNTLFLASHNISSRIIGGAIFTISHEKNDIVCYYWQAFTSKEGRTSLSQYSLLYQGILWGKKMGAKIFDFEGIYDERFPNKNWLGFSHFKKSFGGFPVEYPGCYIKFGIPGKISL